MSVFTRFLEGSRPLVVTDTETTGTSAAHNRIIEIGAIAVHPDGTRTTFSHLVNPETAVPYRITRITGLSTGHVANKPRAAEVLPDYMAFLGDGIFTAHNIGFDRAFLNAELVRAGLDELDHAELCSLRLARRLLPGLRSKSLGNLAAFFKLDGQGRHRALRDAEVTVAVLERLLLIAEQEHGIHHIAELLELQRKTYASVRPSSPHLNRIRTDVLPHVPEESGVYFMKDGQGKVLYVGKAKTLSSRVRSYFTAVEAHPGRIRNLVAKVRSVDWQTTETELNALILESRLIKEIDPPFNRALRRHVARPFLRIDWNEPFPRVTAQVIVRDDGAEWFGPLRSRAEAASVLELIERLFAVRNCSSADLAGGRRCLRGDIGRCTMPCENTDREAYIAEIRRVEAFLRGDSDWVEDRLMADMAHAAAELDFEEAARVRDWLAWIANGRMRMGAVVRPLDGPDTLYWLDGASVTCAVVRGGLVHWSGRMPPPVGAGNLQFTFERLETVLAECPDPRDPTSPVEADARRILEQWMHANRDELLVVQRQEGESVSAFVNRVMDAVVEN